MAQGASLPEGRQALGLTLVIAAGLLYISAGFAIKVITERGASSFLVSYVSSCLFVLHLPCAMLARWCRQRRTSGFWELSNKEKTSDSGDSAEADSPRQWKSVAGRGEAEGCDWDGGAAELELKAVAVDERDVGSERGFTPRMGAPLSGPEESSGELSIRSDSRPQTPILSILDGWKVPIHRSKLIELMGRGGPVKVSAGRTPVGSRSSGGLLLKQDGAELKSFVEHRVASQESSGLGTQGQVPFPSDVEAAQYDVLGSTEAVVTDCVGSCWDPRQGPFGLCSEHWEAVKVAAVVGPLWFMAQYTYTLSLTLTTVSSNTIIFSSTSLFTFLISVIWLREPFTVFKLAMIVCAMLGTVVVSISDVKSPSKTHNSLTSASGAALGNGLAFVAALVYAVYATSVKYTMPEESECVLDGRSGKPVKRPVSTSLVFGYMGLLSGVFLLPCLLVLAWVGLENLRWLGAKTFGLLIVKGVFGNVVADYLCARAMLLTTPTAASVGLAIQTPIAILADLVIFGIYPKALMLVGGVFVLLGFVGINLDLGPRSSKT